MSDIPTRSSKRLLGIPASPVADFVERKQRGDKGKARVVSSVEGRPDCRAENQVKTVAEQGTTGESGRKEESPTRAKKVAGRGPPLKEVEGLKKHH